MHNTFSFIFFADVVLRHVIALFVSEGYTKGISEARMNPYFQMSDQLHHSLVRSVRRLLNVHEGGIVRYGVEEVNYLSEFSIYILLCWRDESCPMIVAPCGSMKV